MRAVVMAEHPGAALGGVVVLAILVNVVELLCTAGFPVVYTRILTLRELPVWKYYGYLVLYNVAYVLDDGLMLALAVLTPEWPQAPGPGGAVAQARERGGMLGIASVTCSSVSPSARVSLACHGTAHRRIARARME
jgi:hypothetical protein